MKLLKTSADVVEMLTLVECAKKGSDYDAAHYVLLAAIKQTVTFKEEVPIDIYFASDAHTEVRLEDSGHEDLLYIVDRETGTKQAIPTQNFSLDVLCVLFRNDLLKKASQRPRENPVNVADDTDWFSEASDRLGLVVEDVPRNWLSEKFLASLIDGGVLTAPGTSGE